MSLAPRAPRLAPRLRAGRGSGTICRNDPKGAARKWFLTPWALLLAAAVLLSGCSDWPSPRQPQVPDPIFELPMAPRKAVEAVEAKKPDPDDLIQPGDNLEVFVRRGGGEEKYQVTVQANGVVTVSFTPVEVTGLDESAAEKRITEAIAPFVRNPRVQVRLVRGVERERFIYVTGEVRRGGRLKIGKRTTVLSAVAIGEGFTDIADMSKIVVISPRGEGKNLVRVADIETALLTGDLSADLSLKDGDVVFVPRSSIGDWSVYYTRVLLPVLNTAMTTVNTVLISKVLADLFMAEQVPLAVGAGGGACWVARALYGDQAWQVPFLRWYIWGPLSEQWYGRLFADLYVQYGQQVARVLQRHPGLQVIVRPVFDYLLEQAIAAAGRERHGEGVTRRRGDTAMSPRPRVPASPRLRIPVSS